MIFRHGTALLALLVAQSRFINGILVDICSTQNTASGNGVSYNLMSLGYCSDQICVGSAYAITQGDTCWCSDIAPSLAVSTKSCNQPCPGFPFEFCGSTGGLFSYVQLGTPSSTAGASSSSSSKAQSQVTVIQTIVSTIVSNSVVYSTTAIYRTKIITPSAPSGSSPSTSLLPSTIPEVYTSGNVVRTKYITETPYAPNPAASGSLVQENRGLSAGAIAGVVIGVVVGILLLVLLGFLCLRRRRRDDDERDDTRVAETGMIGRASSVLSSGLRRHGSNRRGPSSGSANGSRPSRLTTENPDMSEGPSSAASANLERRDSRPLFRDQRLNPHATVMMHPDASHTSLQTLEDNHDYSRPLEVRNP